MSLQDLADIVGTSNPQISHLELGKRKLTWDWMQRISRALECHPMDLVEGLPQPRTSDEKKLLETYRGLEDKPREMLSTMLESLASAEAKKRAENILYDQDSARESQKKNSTQKSSGKEE